MTLALKMGESLFDISLYALFSPPSRCMGVEVFDLIEDLVFQTEFMAVF